MTDQKQQYLIEPKHKKSVCEEQTWTNTLKNGKSVSVKVGNVYRGGEFHITINEKEKAELLKKIEKERDERRREQKKSTLKGNIILTLFLDSM